MWVEKNGPSWRIRDRIAGKKVTLEEGWPTRTAAKARMTALRSDQLRGDFIDPRGGKLLLSDWIAAWWPSYEASLKPSARKSEGSRVRTHIEPLLGRYSLDDLDSLVIQRFVSMLSVGERDPADATRWVRKPLAPKTVRNVHGVLHKVLEAAVRARRLRANPATGSAMPPRRHKEMRFLTPPEIGRLLAACSSDLERWRPLVMLMVSTGLRYGEAIGLKVGRVDVLAGTLTVLETMHEAGKGEYIFTEPKSEQSRRTVSITPELAAELVPLVASKDRDELVFTEPDGQPVTRNFRQRVWKRITERAGLTGLRLHDLRHTLAAVLISAGVPLTAVQRLLGHSSIRVTSDMYGHLMPEVDASILAAVSASLPGQGRGIEPISTATNGDERRSTGTSEAVSAP